MRKIFILFCITLFATSTFASTFIREFSFEPSGQIRKVQAREETIVSIKGEIIDDLFASAKNSYLSGKYKPESTLTSEQTKKLYPLITLTKYYKERWDGNSYYMKAEFDVDEGKVLRYFKNMDRDSVEDKPISIKSKEEEIKNKSSQEEKENPQIEFKIKSDIEPLKNDKTEEILEIKDEKKIIIPKKTEDYSSGLQTVNYSQAENHFLFDEALAAQTSGDLEKAKKKYREIIEIEPDNAEAYNNLGIILSRTGDFENAFKSFDKAIELNPDCAETYNNLGNAYEHNFENEKAIGWFKKAIKIDENYTDAYYNLGRTYAELQEFDKAEETYRKAIKIDKNYAFSYYGLGNLFGKQRDFNKAIEWYQKAIEVNPEFPDAYYKLGITFGLKGDFENGMKNIDIADSLGYDENAPRINVSHLAKSTDNESDLQDEEESEISATPKTSKKKTESTPKLSKKIDKKNDKQINTENLEKKSAKSNEFKTKKSKAISPEEIPEIQLTKIITKKTPESILPTETDKIGTDDTEIIAPQKLNNAKAAEISEDEFEKPLETEELYAAFDDLLKTKQEEKANADFVQETSDDQPPEALLQTVKNVNKEVSKDNDFSFLLAEQEEENEPEYANIREAIADFFQKASKAYINGDFAKSIDYYGGVIELDRKNSSAYYSIGTTYARMQNYSPAIDNLKKAIKYDPEFAKAYDNLGFVYFKMAEYNNAIVYLQKAVEIDSSLANAFCNLGDAYYKLNEHQKKIEYYKKAAQLGDKKAQKFLKNIGFSWE
ncbi:MAG: tetratricopeptide repeat protein [Candidatus Cloacimonadota bacterium]|nr:tetratricopeptide repeat protein [Candidatus Cloacimonadota bacterium]